MENIEKYKKGDKFIVKRNFESATKKYFVEIFYYCEFDYFMNYLDYPYLRFKIINTNKVLEINLSDINKEFFIYRIKHMKLKACQDL